MSQSNARRQRRAQAGNGGPVKPTAAELMRLAAGGKILGQPDEAKPPPFFGLVTDMVSPMRVIADTQKREAVIEFQMPAHIIRYRMSRDLTNQMRVMLGDALEAFDAADKEGEALS